MLFKVKPFKTAQSLVSREAHRPLGAVALVLSITLLALSGCAGAPAVVKPAVEAPQWRLASGGAYVAACREGQTVTALSHFALERWTLHDNRPPSLANRRVANLNPLRPFTVADCQADGTGHAITGDRPFSTRMDAQRHFVVSSAGRAVIRDGQYLDWRTVVSGVEGATFDGSSLWLVGRNSLWQFNAKHRTMTPKALPSEIGARGPVAVFRDGQALWIRTRDGYGWPVVVRGNYVHPLRKGGPLPTTSAGTQIPVGQYTVHWDGPGQTLRAQIQSDTVHTIEQVDALLPLNGRYLLIGSGSSVSFWDLANARMTRIREWSFGGVTLAFFLKGEVLYAVGRNYGVVIGALHKKDMPN